MNTAAIEGGWTAGTLFGVPLLVITCLVIIGFALWLMQDDAPLALLLGIGSLFLAVGLGALGFYPFQKDYHYWTPVTGTVEAVDKRLVADGEGMSEKIVVRFEGDPQQYGITDTRAALLRPGSEAALLCKRAHEWGPSVDGLDCRWGGA